jgi:D-3-phosphoglycerate dehydrogenase
MKPKILFMCKIGDPEAKDRIRKHADITEIESVRPDDILRNLPGMEALIVPYTDNMLVTREIIDAGKALKLIGSTYGGVSQNIEAEHALSKGLTVIHTGGSRPRPMAEYTLGLILGSLTQIHNYHHYMRSGEAWPRSKFPRTRILGGRKVGIIGFGRIGAGILELMRCFTADIAVCSGHLTDAAAGKLGARKMELNTLFADREIIILAAGLTPETRRMIGAEQFALMRGNALFVNISRGGIVDQRAMIEAVSSKNIYLALDVFDPEPLEDDSPLRKNDRVLITPHRANNTIEFEQRWACLADELELFFSGKRPESALTLERLKTMSAS